MKWLAWTIGGTVMGVAAWRLWHNQQSSSRREIEQNSPLRQDSHLGQNPPLGQSPPLEKNPPLEKMADQLQHAWAEPHNTAV
jgi:hypothetical protein